MRDLGTAIEKRARKAIEDHVFPGCVIGVVRKSGMREIWPFGTLTYEVSSPVVREDTIYDIASITKSIPTASLALQFIDEGKMILEEQIRTYLPELRNDYDATVEDLFLYRVHGPQLSTLKEKTPDKILVHVFERGFDGPPGESRYTNLPALVLGLIIERVGDDTLDRLAQKYFFNPLKMENTTFFPNDGDRISIIAPTEIDERGETIQGIVHDESARVFALRGRAVGHAGLFSAVSDILNFLEALLQGRLPAVTLGAQKGLGWQVNDSRVMGKHSHAKMFGKTGFTGTSVICDVERGVAFVILSNRTYPKRPADDGAINAFRRDIADIVLRP